MTTTELGQRAERLVARHLQALGYKVIAQNWKTKTCEIDLIAYKNNTVCFVEVKYRSRGSYNKGLNYITASKQKQMSYAAKLWVARHNWHGSYRLSAASVSRLGEIVFIEQI